MLARTFRDTTRLLNINRNVVLRAQVSSSPQIDFGTFPEHRSLVIEKYGEPVDSVLLKRRRPEDVLPNELGPNQVLLEHLASCINPADINLIQGVYGVKPELPAIVGGEGITRVHSVGSEVKHLSPGDLATGISFMNYWQSYSVQNGQDFYKVDNNLDVTTAAQLRVNPCTAYRMMKDFKNLESGDVIIQNGANSAVGAYVIQLAKLWGLKTINVIRDRPDKENIVNELMRYGADIVVTEAEVSSVEHMSPILKRIGKPKLFLNCVGGKNAMNCQRLLEHGGYSVTYGAMSKQPFSLTATSLIFKDHRYVGFWVSRWYKERVQQRSAEIEAMLNDVSQMFVRGILKPKPSTLVDFEDRNVAFSGSNNTKYIFSINKR